MKEIESILKYNEKEILNSLKVLSDKIDKELIRKYGDKYFNFKKLNLIHLENIKKNWNVDLVKNAYYLQDDCNYKYEEIDVFQKIIREQKNEMNTCLKLVAIDVSKTIIEYIINEESLMKGANAIRRYLLENNISNYNINESSIINNFNVGFKKYENFRNQKHIELDEIEVYKKYIIPEFNFDKNILTDEVIKELIEIWMKSSVNLALNTKKIEKLITELKERRLVVVTVSDMLGEMSHYALKKLGVYDLFDGHFCSNDFKLRKNNRDKSLFNIINEVTQIPSGQSMVIGNDLIDDIISAKKCGWSKAIFLNFGNTTFSQSIDLNFVDLDDFYYNLRNDAIKFIPKFSYTPYSDNVLASRVDDNFTKTLYLLRSIVKKISNREIRELYYKDYLTYNLGEGTRLGNNIEIRYPERIYIGKNCQINDNVTILNESPVVLGNNIMIGAGVFMSTYKHDWRIGMIQNDVPSWKKGNTSLGPISIESNVWIAPGCVFESDVYIGHHSIISANTLIKSGVYPPYSFIAGNPGKVIKSIKDELNDIFFSKYGLIGKKYE